MKTERGEITTDSTKIQVIIRNNYEQLYANKFDNLSKMDKFLETYNLPKFNKEVWEYLNRTITTNDFETVIKRLSTNKSPGLDSYIGEFYLTFKKELIPVLLTLFQKNQEEGRFQAHFKRSALS